MKPNIEYLKIHYMKCNSFFLSCKIKHIVKDLYKREKMILIVITQVKIMNFSQMSIQKILLKKISILLKDFGSTNYVS